MEEETQRRHSWTQQLQHKGRGGMLAVSYFTGHFQIQLRNLTFFCPNSGIRR